MADDDVDVTIGATTDDLASGLDSAKDKVSSFAESLKSGFSGAEGAIEGVASKLAIFGLAIQGVEKIAGALKSVWDVIEGNAIESADSLKNLSTETGYSRDQLQRWQGVAAVYGVDIDHLTQAFTHLSLGSKEVREGLQNIGLRFDDIKKLDPAEQFETIRDKLEEFKDSAAKAANAAKLLGTSMKYEDIKGVGSDFVENAAKQDVLTEQQLKQLDELKDAWDKLTKGVTIDIKQLSAAIAPWATDVVKWFDSIIDKVNAGIKSFGEWAAAATKMFSNAAPKSAAGMISGGGVTTTATPAGQEQPSKKTAEDEEDDSKKAKDLVLQNYELMEQAAMISALGRVRAADIEFQQTSEKIKMAALTAGLAENERTALEIAAINKRRSAEDAALNESMAKLESEGLKSSITYQHLASRKVEIEQQTALELLKIQEEEVQQESQKRAETAQNIIRQADITYQQTVEKVNVAAQVFGIKENEKTSMLVKAVQERLALEISGITVQMSYYDQSSATYKKLVDQKVQLEQKANTDILKLGATLMEQQEAQWKSAADTIAGSFTGQLRGLIAGTETWRVAMSKIAADLIMDMIGHFVKLGAEWAAQQLYMLAVKTTTNASMTASDAATAAAGLPAKVATFTSTISSDAAQAFAGAFAFYTPTLGLAAAGPAAAAQASVLAELANVPKFQVGIDYVPHDMLAMLHQGEAVTPAEQNTPSGPMGGSSGMSLNVTAIDAASFASALRNNQSPLSIVLRNMARSNPSMITGLINRS